MKDGFDRSVAEKMPKIQKKRPNRPWNVDPVLLKAQDEEKIEVREILNPGEEASAPAALEARETAAESKRQVKQKTAVETVALSAASEEQEIVPAAGIEHKGEIKVEPVLQIAVLQKNESVIRAVETIKEISSDFTQMIFEKKEIQQQLDKRSSAVEEVSRENARLKASIQEIEKGALDNTLIEREIDFLNEQLEDADLYIQNMVGLLEEKTQTLEQETTRRTDVEGRFSKLNKEIHEKAKMDVKISILERDLSISNGRAYELESKLEEEYQKREPLEQEIVELKNALDRVYSSLAHIRLKAKREVYGS